DPSSGISLEDVLRPTKRHPACRRREAQPGSCMERENLCGDAKRPALGLKSCATLQANQTVTGTVVNLLTYRGTTLGTTFCGFRSGACGDTKRHPFLARGLAAARISSPSRRALGPGCGRALGITMTDLVMDTVLFFSTAVFVSSVVVGAVHF